MHPENSKKLLPYQLISTRLSGWGIRHFLINRKTNIPAPAASLYEVNLSQSSDSYNTPKTALYNIAFLYSWAIDQDIDLDQLLLCGRGLSRPQIRSFVGWLRRRAKTHGGGMPLSKRRSINAKLTACATACVWFINQFANRSGLDFGSAEIELMAQSQARAWSDAKLKSPKNGVAPDLSESEIATIEAFLNPYNHRRPISNDLAFRDYLIWRMAIEFGMRLGEILAMRTSDCPTRNAPYFRVVRIEERGENYHDPRKEPPRPKTLSRDLGFLYQQTRFPSLASNYITEHRLPWISHKGKRIRKLILSHEFLITNNRGHPLSIRSAEKIAKDIREGTGIDFHWHLARHAFFNRAYSDIAGIEHQDTYQAKFDDLVWWGGWSDPTSMAQYIRRARAERARAPLKLLQNGSKIWTALN
jgi:integrase